MKKGGSMEHDIKVRLVKGLDAALVAVPFFLCWYGYYASRTYSPFFRRGNYLVVLLFLVVYIIYGRMYDGFRISLNRVPDIVCSQGLAAFMADCVMYVVVWLLMKHMPNPLPLMGAFAGQMLLSVLWAAGANRWYFRSYPPMEAAVVYDQRAGMEKLVEEYGLERKFAVRRTAKAGECLARMEMLDGLDAVFLSGIHSHERNIILKYCVEKGIEVFVIPRIGDVIMSGARKRHMFHLPVLQAGRYRPSPEYLFAKRFCDVAVSGAALIVLSPVLLITAAAIRACDGGPVFYRQCRLTKDGRKFDVLKFRSMRVDAEKDGIARLSSGERDDRVTPVGRFIRRVRIDELPQLFNILKGEMSLVGPRPERPEIAEEYGKELPEFSLRLQAKAGLTGYAQVYGKYNTEPYDKLQMDLMYIANPSLAEDFKILFETVRVVLFTSEKSTEGIREGQVGAMEPYRCGGMEETEEMERIPAELADAGK